MTVCLTYFLFADTYFLFADTYFLFADTYFLFADKSSVAIDSVLCYIMYDNNLLINYHYQNRNKRIRLNIMKTIKKHNRIFSAVIAAALLFGIISLSVLSAATAEVAAVEEAADEFGNCIVNAGAVDNTDISSGYLRGDADGDGDITIVDATVIQRVLAGIKEDPDGGIALRGSVTDSVLNIMDATAIQRYLADLEDTHGIGTPVGEEPTEVVLPTDPNQLPIITV